MSDANQGAEQQSGLAGFVSHLVELRDRLLKMVLAVIVVFLCLFPFGNDIYTALSGPLTQHLPEGSSMIAIEVASPFLVPFKLSLLLAVFITAPYWLYQLWGFVAPGLYDREKRLVTPLLTSSVALFYAGGAFAYFVVFPLVFKFFTSVAPEGVSVMTDIGKYLDFIMALFFAFGLAFEVPIATILLVAVGATTPDRLAAKRPYIIVGAFIVGMFLTPPDVVSQLLMALPMWLLFEFGVIFSRILVRKREEQAAADEQAEEAAEAEESPVAAAAGAGHTRSEAPTSGGGWSEREDEEYREPDDDEFEAEFDRIEDEMRDLEEGERDRDDAPEDDAEKDDEDDRPRRD